jgi:cell division protein FtsZ
MPTHPPSTAPVRLPDESPQSARIKVVGVGGGGSNAIDRMIDFGVEGVEFIALNTDVQALEVSKAPVRGQLGSLLTHGLSAGSDPNVGRRAAIQDAAEIAEVLEGADMVFITAGLGGGTGTGAAPVIAAIASEMGALTVAIVTRPFNFEGKRRMAIADWGIDHLLRYVDTLIVIPNEKLLAIAKDAPFFESFKIADDFLRQAVQGISDIITTEGVINRDFADVKTTMAGMGYAVMGTASRSGPNRAVDAVMDAMASPLLEEGAIDGARGILINITGSSTLRLSEVNAASRVIQNVAHEDANIIFGAVLDERLGDEVKATVIVTGFHSDGRDRSERRARLLRASAPEPARPALAEPEPPRLVAAAPEPTTPEAVEPAAEEETPPAEPSVYEAPLVDSPLPDQPEPIELASAEIIAIEEEAVEVETIEWIAIEEEQVAIAESSPEEPVLEIPEPPEAVQEPIEEAPHDGDQDLDLAIEVYAVKDVQVEDPPQHHLLETEVAEPAEFEASEELAASEESRSDLQDEEEDWREVIREIARLAEPIFEVEDQKAGEAANPPAARKDRAPAASSDTTASAHLATTRRAALAAYAAVSFPETAPIPELEDETEQPQPKAVNAFAQILEARRRFVEKLSTPLPAEESFTPSRPAPPETHERASFAEPERQEQNRRYHQDEPAVELEPAPPRQTRSPRPLTIDAESSSIATSSDKSPSLREEQHPSGMPLFTEAAAEDLPKPLADSKRRLHREDTPQGNGELFERKWNSEIRVPSFGSLSDRERTTESDDLDTPSFLRRGK